MGGFALALGGAGDAAQQYGAQVRNHLESRREQYANLLQQRANEESDPTLRTTYLQGVSDILAGKDFGKILPPLIKAHDAHQQSTQVLGQIGQSAFGGQGPKQLPPGPALPGMQPGTQPLAPAAAAQPSSNPLTNTGPIQTPGAGLSPVAAAGASAAPVPVSAPTQTPMIPPVSSPGASPIPPVNTAATPATPSFLPPGLPQPEDPAQIMRETMQNPLWAAPANRPLLLAQAQQRMSHQEGLRSTLETQQANMAYHQQGLQRMKESGEFEKLPAYLQTELTAQAYGFPAMSGAAGMFTPHVTAPNASGKGLPEGVTDISGQPLDRSGGVEYRIEQLPGMPPMYYRLSPKALQTETAGGGKQLSNKFTGESIAPIAGAVDPSMNSLVNLGINPAGQKEFGLKSEMLHPTGKSPIIGGYAPGAMGTASTTSMNANGDMSTVRTRTPPAGSGGKVGGGASVVPPVRVPGSAGVADNAAAAPLNGPQNTIEARARQAVERSFTSGKEAQMARSNNTALEHLDMLNEAYKQLKSNNIPAANSLINRLGKTLGLSGQTNFDTVAQRVGQETNSAYVSGGGGELERLESSAHFGSNMSPEQFHDNLVSTMRLMGSLQENLQGEYDRGTYGVGRLKVLTPTSIAIKKKYLGGTTTVPPVAGDAAKRLIDKYK